MYSIRIMGIPEQLRTPLISPYSPNTSNTPTELNTSNSSGFSLRLKKLILTRRNARGGKRVIRVERLENLEWIE